MGGVHRFSGLAVLGLRGGGEGGRGRGRHWLHGPCLKGGGGGVAALLCPHPLVLTLRFSPSADASAPTLPLPLPSPSADASAPTLPLPLSLPLPPCPCHPAPASATLPLPPCPCHPATASLPLTPCPCPGLCPPCPCLSPCPCPCPCLCPCPHRQLRLCWVVERPHYVLCLPGVTAPQGVT